MKPRIIAFAVHLLLSGLVAIGSIILVFFVWYPMPLHQAVGVTDIFLLLLSVDIVIGPLLTLVVYKPDKPSLKFDLAVIALLQLCALSYGLYTVFQGRPAFVVFCKDRFEIARASDLDVASMQKALQSQNASAVSGWGKPRWVGAVAASDPERNQEIMFSAVMGGPDWSLLPELFVPLAQVNSQIMQKAKPLQSLRQLHSKEEGIDSQLDWQNDQLKWLPLRGKVKDMAVLVDANTAKVVDVIDISPWH
jgi:hypothetical protein